MLVDIGGFLGIGARTVALDMSQIHFLRDEYRRELRGGHKFARSARGRPGVPAGDGRDRRGREPRRGRHHRCRGPGHGRGASRPAFEREGFTTADYDQLTADDLEEAAVYDANDENIGSVEELILSQDGKIEQAIVDVGGFLGMGEHRIGLAFDEMQVMTNADNSEVRVYIDQTRQTLEQRPEYQQ